MTIFMIIVVVFVFVFGCIVFYEKVRQRELLVLVGTPSFLEILLLFGFVGTRTTAFS